MGETLPTDRVPGRIIAIHSGKGGAGRTTLAVNLACSISMEQRQRVVVVDLDLQFGDIATIVEVPEIHGSLFDLVTGDPGDLDVDHLRAAVVGGPGGISLLPGPTRPELAELVEASRENISRLLELLRQEFDVVIVDAGRHVADAVATLFDHADAILLVTTATALSLKNLRLTLALLDLLAVPAERVGVVLNRVEPHANFGTDEVETNLEHTVLAVIPHDSKLAVNAVDGGEPFVIAWPRAPISAAIRRLGEDVLRSPLAHAHAEAR
jgi:pilus assembly protein CpaE